MPRRGNVGINTQGFVYFVHAKGTDFYKIGFTRRSIKYRLEEIATHTPYGLECLLYAPGTGLDESTLHQSLKAYRLHNEWFEIRQADFRHLLAARYGITTDAEIEAAIENFRVRGEWED